MMIFYRLAVLLQKRALYSLLCFYGTLLMGLLMSSTALAQEINVEIVYDICLGAEANLTPTTNGDCYRWSSDNELDNDNISSNNTFSCPSCASEEEEEAGFDCFTCPRLTVQPEETTVYSLVIIDDQGNIVKQEKHIVKVNAEIFPVSVLTTDPVVCLSEPPGFSNGDIGEQRNSNTCGTAILFMEENYQSYVWSTQETSSEITVELGGTYTVTVTDENGCRGIGQIQISEEYCVEVTLTATTTAIGEGEESVLKVEEDFDSYTWSLNGEVIEGQNSNVYTAEVEGIYSVQVVNNEGCLGRSEVVVEEINEPFIQYFYRPIAKYEQPSIPSAIDEQVAKTIVNQSSVGVYKRIKNGETLYLCQSSLNNSTVTLVGFKNASELLSSSAQWNGNLVDGSMIGDRVKVKVDITSTTLNGSILTVINEDISISINIVVIGSITKKDSNHKYAWDAVEDEMVDELDINGNIIASHTFNIEDYSLTNRYHSKQQKGLPWIFIKGGDKGIAKVELEPAGIHSVIHEIEDIESGLTLSVQDPISDNFVLEVNSNTISGYNETLITISVEDTNNPDIPFCQCPLLQVLNSENIELDVFYRNLIEENDDHQQVPLFSSVNSGDVVITANKADGTGANFLDTNLADYSNTTDFEESTAFINGVNQKVIKYIGTSSGQSVIPVNNTNQNSPPQNLMPSPTNHQTAINNIIFNKIGINWTLTKKSDLTCNYDLDRDGKIIWDAPLSSLERKEVRNNDGLSGYHEMIYHTPQLNPPPPVTDDNSFAPFNSYFTIIKWVNIGSTTSHEFGHGLGNLFHTFEIFGLTSSQGKWKDRYNLMNYNRPAFSKQILRYFQWHKIVPKSHYRKTNRYAP